MILNTQMTLLSIQETKKEGVGVEARMRKRKRVVVERPLQMQQLKLSRLKVLARLNLTN